jgi:hypothetical protein
MTELFTAQADALLLLLEENEFLDIGAVIGLRSRPTVGEDLKIIDEFLEGELCEISVGESRQQLLLGYLPDLPPQ